ncbi:unnamed protein product [Calypogeia fissa]
MQCCVASTLSSLWPCEVFGSTREKNIGGRSSSLGGYVSLSGRRKEWRGRLICSGSRSDLGYRLGFLGNGMLLSQNELRKWTEEYFLSSGSSSSSAAADGRREGGRVQASLLVDPAVWMIRTTVFYVLLETGIAAPGRSRRASDSGDQQSEGQGPLAWIGKLIDGDPVDKRNKELAKLRNKWHSNTKGILVRKYRVPSKMVGKRLLTAISSLLADDDTFRDVATHKGCQIRRENAHAESVCCHNVRALFDELPTPHLVVEITGPIDTAHYEKADKIEKVLRTGASI